jgi:hypothetical protein
MSTSPPGAHAVVAACASIDGETRPSPENTEKNAEVVGGDAALRMILEGTASETGERFFTALVENLARTLGTYSAWVTEYLPQPRGMRALAFCVAGDWVEGY